MTLHTGGTDLGTHSQEGPVLSSPSSGRLFSSPCRSAGQPASATCQRSRKIRLLMCGDEQRPEPMVAGTNALHQQGVRETERDDDKEKGRAWARVRQARGQGQALKEALTWARARAKAAPKSKHLLKWNFEKVSASCPERCPGHRVPSL